MIYLAFESGLLLGFLAAGQLDRLLLQLGVHNFGRKLGPGVSALVAVVGPGVAHLLLGRVATSIYTAGALFCVMGLVPVPWQISSISLGFTLVPLWLVSVADAYCVAKTSQN